MRIFLKILGWVAALAILAGAGYFIYQYFTAEEGAPAPAPGAQTPVETPITADGAIKTVSGNPVPDFWVNYKTGDIYFVKEDGKLAKAGANGVDRELGGQFITGFNRFIPSPDGTKAIAVIDYPYNPVFAVYDAANNTWERLPEGVFTAAFDPSSSKIAYLNNRGLFVLDLNSKKSAEMMKLNIADGELRWSGVNDLFLISEGVWYINPAQKTIVNATGGETGAAYNFNNKSYNALKFVRRGANDAALVFTHQIGGVIKELPFKTLPSKCVFGEHTLYCAVPKNFPSRANLPDDYLKEKLYTEDVFVSYNLEEASDDFDIIHQGEASIDADHLAIKGKQLIFRNRYDGKLYSLDLKNR